MSRNLKTTNLKRQEIKKKNISFERKFWKKIMWEKISNITICIFMIYAYFSLFKCIVAE